MSNKLSKDEEEQVAYIEKLQREFLDKIGEHTDSTIIISTKHFGMEGSVSISQHVGNYYSVIGSINEYARKKDQKDREIVKQYMKQSNSESDE